MSRSWFGLLRMLVVEVEVGRVWGLPTSAWLEPAERMIGMIRGAGAA